MKSQVNIKGRYVVWSRLLAAFLLANAVAPLVYGDGYVYFALSLIQVVLALGVFVFNPIAFFSVTILGFFGVMFSLHYLEFLGGWFLPAFLSCIFMSFSSERLRAEIYGFLDEEKEEVAGAKVGEEARPSA